MRRTPRGEAVTTPSLTSVGGEDARSRIVALLGSLPAPSSLGTEEKACPQIVTVQVTADVSQRNYAQGARSAPTDVGGYAIAAQSVRLSKQLRFIERRNQVTM